MPLVPVISVVGKSDVGKTTFLEKLIPELVRRGYRVGTVKHDVHGFEPDTPGKDTWRHAQAGSRAVAISGPNKVALFLSVGQEARLDEVAELIEGQVDLILTEGYKREGKLKIEISRAEKGTELLCSAEELLCLVTDSERPLPVPQFGLDDAAGVADLIEEKVLRGPDVHRASLVVDGRPIEMQGFVADILDAVIRGVVTRLKGCESAGEIAVRLRPRLLGEHMAEARRDRGPSG